ncbi:hypothetical protein C5Y93_14355 [Blastopirellula marina]|uniref:Uncharacterized protein n=2 Tax=Blastopirellula marina TaxID=124 RepID=A0A2S8GMF5_9BACT|nr:hypothetical protein C5Y93_14355 [Blastopirellula marina]
MPIDFDCAVCKHPIRVPDGAEGKRTKCPKCQAIQPVPSAQDDEFRLKESEFEDPPAGGSSASMTEVLAPLPSRAPLSDEQRPKDVSASGDDFEDTYADDYSSQVGANAARAEAFEKIQTPALISMILTGLGIVSDLVLSIVWTVSTLSDQDVENPAVWVTIGTIIFAFAISLQGLALFGSYQARDLKNFGLAWAGFIIALLPCSFFFILNIPISVWGMTVLSDGGVQRQFED